MACMCFQFPITLIAKFHHNQQTGLFTKHTFISHHVIIKHCLFVCLICMWLESAFLACVADVICASSLKTLGLLS